ncbi:JAB domain-containing protein [Rhizobium sp. MC63]|uniref:JAB domain-containing protein n=1 Tax=Rhizobium mulingense TaxID=3031128 RepID=UPI0023D7E59E|nr:JAB domain-containing protein [Rhizobium sp. MC63]MDF0697897.1 JAB domain-containing protein [Rhizobium sp. MC63]
MTSPAHEKPSRADIDLTKVIIGVAYALDMIVHDYVIVGKNSQTDLKMLKLIKHRSG